MLGRGTVVALDKSRSKVTQIEENCRRLRVPEGAVRCHAIDAAKSCSEEEDGVPCDLSGPPPFAPRSFDRVLLDAPCSAMGQRPQFRNNMKGKELRSFPRQLFYYSILSIRETTFFLLLQVAEEAFQGRRPSAQARGRFVVQVSYVGERTRSCCISAFFVTQYLWHLKRFSPEEEAFFFPISAAAVVTAALFLTPLPPFADKTSFT